MLLNNLIPYLALFGLGADVAFCARNIKQTVSDMDAVTESVQDLHKAMDGYNGGVFEALPVANKLQAAQRATEKAAEGLDADAEPFSDAEATEAMHSYNQMVPVVVDALHVAAEKAPEFRKAGVADIAHNLVDNFYNDKNKFEDAYKRKLSNGENRDISKPAEQVDSAFKAVSAALSA